MARIETWFKQDLQELVKVSYIGGNVFSQDNEGNLVGVEVFNNGQPVTLSGSISGNVIRSDGVTVAVAGSFSGNRASIILPDDAYIVPGVITIVIKNAVGSQITTLAVCVVNVYRTSTEEIMDSGTIIPSVAALIAAIDEAVSSIPADYSSLWESLAPPFSTSVNYLVGQYTTYDGGLYRFTSNHDAGTWDAEDVTTVDIGSDVYEIKSRFDTVENQITYVDSALKQDERQEIIILENRAWDDTSVYPKVVTASGYYGCKNVITYYRDALFETNANPGVSISFICYDQNSEKIDVVSNYKDIPVNTYYFVFYARHDSMTKAYYTRFTSASYIESFCNDISIEGGAWDDSTTAPTKVVASGYYRCADVIPYYEGSFLATDANPAVILYYVYYDENKQKLGKVESFDKIPSDAKYFVFYARHDSLTKGVYTKGGGEHKVLNASDIGFLPSNSASDNTNALQKALFGGKRTIIVSQPGVYDLDDTILLDSNTELVFCKGVIINKSADYRYVFINRGAYTRTYNANITIRGLRLTGLDHESYDIEDDTSLFGMRGHISFLCTHNVKIYDYKSENCGSVQYVIQLNLCDNFIIDGADIAGDKDGIHISSSHKFVIRNCSFKTADDFIALNASDWASSNCVDGNIYDGTIENIIVREGTNGFFRFLVGAWVDWYSGIKVRRSEIVMNNGNLYRVFAQPGDVEFTSGTEPTNTDYNETQADSGGFTWLLMEKNVPDKYSTNIWNISVRNIVNYSLRQTFLLQTFRRDNAYARTLSEDVALDDLPKIDISIANAAMPGGVEPFSSTDMDYVNLRLRVNGMNDIHRELGIPSASVSSDVNKWISLTGIDFTKNGDQYDIETKAGSVVYVNDCKYNESIKGDLLGRVVSNCVFDSTPAQAVEGDIIHTETGLYIRKNNAWVAL